MEKIRQALISIKEEVLIIFLVVLFLTFMFSQNGIPSNSMETTLGVGDRIIVSMLPYYYRNPERYEIVVFNGPDGKKWIKRVIGLPGETIDICEGKVYVDGTQLVEDYLPGEGDSTPDPMLMAVSFPYTVPEGKYFLMGDNRFASYDCRYIGAIDEKEITGKPLLRIFPFNKISKLNDK